MALATATPAPAQSRPDSPPAVAPPIAPSPLDELGHGPSDVNAPKTSADPHAARGNIAHEIPSVMSPADVRIYAQRMRLSDAQQQAIVASYRAYCDHVERLYAEHHAALVELNIAAGEHRGHDVEFLNLFTPMRQRENQYLKQLTDAEEKFFAGLLPILAEEQWPLHEAARLHRARNRCYWGYVRLSEAGIDLTKLVDDAQRDEDTLRDLEPLLLEYERAITPIWLMNDEISRGVALDLIRLSVSRFSWDGTGPRPPPPTPQDIEEGRQRQAESRKLREEPVRLQQRLAEINWQYLPRVLELLPEVPRERVRQEFLRRAHPRIYPDPCDPIALYEQAEALLPADSELRPALKSMWDSYRQAYMAQTQKMIDHFRKWNENTALSSAADFENVRIVREARFERWAISERFVNQIIPLLPAEAQQAMDKSAQGFRQSLADQRSREANPRIANP